MSPEQAAGWRVDRRSDVFAVGVVLYELLTHRRAFTGDTPEAVLDKVLNEAPEPMPSIDPRHDKALAAIVDRALEKSVDRRFANLDAMRTALARLSKRLSRGAAAKAPSGVTDLERDDTRARSPLDSPTRVDPGGAPSAPDDAALAPTSDPKLADLQHRLQEAVTSRAHDALAAAERDAYEGRLEALSVLSEDVTDALDRYRSAIAERERRREAQAQGGALVERVRQRVGHARDAIVSGRWTAASDALLALEQEMASSAPPGSAPRRDAQSREGQPGDELPLYLSLARQQLQAGDVSAALSLIEAALGAAGGDERKG
jgi:hypothetical protein